MNLNTITSTTNYVMLFLGAVLAGLIGFDWTAFFTPEEALKIVSGLNILGLVIKSWVVTAEQMAKQIAAAKQTDEKQ